LAGFPAFKKYGMPTPEFIKKYCVLLLCLFSSRAMTQEMSPGVKEIKTAYNNIQKGLETYRIKKINIEGESAQGGFIKGYYKKNRLMLIVDEYFGETGKVRNEYYFEKDKLIFVLEQKFSYNAPFYDSSRFNTNMTNIISEHFYFQNDELILWLYQDKNQIRNNPDLIRNKAKQVLETVSEMKKSLIAKQGS
jgi:hypothetical protein